MYLHIVLEAIKTFFLVSGWTASLYDSDRHTDRQRKEEKRDLMTLLIRTSLLLHQIFTLALPLILVP